MHNLDLAAIVIAITFDIWAIGATVRSVQRTRRIADDGVDELARSITLLARDWEKQRKRQQGASAAG